MKKQTGLRKVGLIIEGVTKPVFKAHGFANQKLITYWPQIVGESLARFTIPQKISFPPNQTRSGVLYIGVTNPGLSLEIQAQESRIVEKISTFFGYQAVTRIRINIARFNTKEEVLESAPKIALSHQEHKNIMQEIDSVNDAELKEKLKSLAASLFDEQH
jgi:hypothetical protein